MIPLHQILFGTIPPSFTKEVTEGIATIGDWFIYETFS